MKFLRPFVLALILATAFFYFTTYRHGRLQSANWFSRPQQVEITEAASGESLDAEEQNNVAVYRKNIGAVVNITSRVMTSSTVLFFTTISPFSETVVSSNVELRMSVPDRNPINSPPSATGN